MPPDRPRRGPTASHDGPLRGQATALLRGLAAVLVVALLATGCGGKGSPGIAGTGSLKSKADNGTSTTKDDKPAADPGYQAPKLGQCYQMTPDQPRASVAAGSRVSCRSQHTTVVAYVGFVPRPVTPRTPVPQRRALGKRLCEPAYRRLAGGTLADRATSILTWTLFTPGQAQLERGARWVRCDVLAPSGNRLVPLPNGHTLLAAGVPEQLRVCQDNSGQDISCSRPHAYRVEAVFRAVGNAYPQAPRFTPVARQRCKELMGKYGGFWQPPSKAGWQAGDRFIRCLSPGAATTP